MAMYTVIGLMSGTSVDGLDIACCSLWHNDGQWQYEIKVAETIVYDDSFAKKLVDTIHLSATDLLKWHNQYGTWMGQQVADFIQKNKLKVDFVAGHGHTIFHQPNDGLTFQLGSGQHLANACGLQVVADFRTNDVALGGQGAPFVPIGDSLLFRNYDVCLNLGGIANMTCWKNNSTIAYDISPINMLFSYILRNSGMAYDDNGQLASAGCIFDPFLDQLNRLEYYQQPFPKSLGFEWFSAEVMPIVDSQKLSVADQLATAVDHVAEQIAANINKVVAGNTNAKVLVTGGGTHNGYFIDTLQQKLSADCQLQVGSELLINFKEALVFALMGVLRMEGKSNCLASVTGAKNDSCSGVVFLPQ
jgi:anhydro-N-acetylmuramic acid kinase